MYSAALLPPARRIKVRALNRLAARSMRVTRMVRTLPHLERLFPGCTWLTVPQVAVCLQLSAGHIYNLHSTGRLPFKMTKFQSGRLRASVRDIATYMGDQQAQVLQGRRRPRGTRLRWLQASSPANGPDIHLTRQKNGTDV